MNIHQLLTEHRNQYLYEGLDKSEKQSVMLWESAGYAIKEAALTPDQIQQLFTSIEQNATAGGSNRTVLGKGKDAASAVNKAWEDLKTKVQDSGPIKAVDQKYDDVVAKIEKGLGGGDNKVNQLIQKYRAFAKAHPVAQGLIYSALIAAAGISGAGLGGAAVLGLLKMTDKLLQGEKFSSAAYSGAKTGAAALAASKIADMFKGGQPAPDAATSGVEKGLSQEQVDYLNQLGKDGATPLVKDNTLWIKQPDGGMQTLQPPRGVDPNDMLKIVKDASNDGVQAAASAVDTAQELTASQMSAIEKAIADGKKLSPQLQASYDLTRGDAGNRLGAAKSGWYDSIDFSERNSLSEGLIYLVFNRICFQQLDEGVLDKIKGVAGAVVDKAKTAGHNLTTKITADKLNQAWQAAGSPMDSEELKSFLVSQGVADDTVNQVYKTLKIKTTSAASTMYAQVKTDLAKLDSKGKKRLTAYLQKQLGTV